jgi:hypothetical protein
MLGRQLYVTYINLLVKFNSVISEIFSTKFSLLDRDVNRSIEFFNQSV